MMGKSVLLLGATGFIGKAILQTLLHEGYTIMALQHNKPLEIMHDRLHIVHASIGSLNIAELPFAPDIIVHAARNKTGRFGRIGRSIVARRGALENKRLLKQIASMPSKPTLVYCSGSLMYGSHKGVVFDEASPLDPVSFARQYVAAEQPFLQALNNSNLNIIMLRLPWVIGAGSWFLWNYLNIMKDKGYVPLYGAANNMMSFVDVEMIGNAIIELVHGGFKGIFNLYHPKYCTQKEWAGTLSSVSALPVSSVRAEEIVTFGAAAMEAFNTNITLGSLHRNLQERLMPYHDSLEQIVKKYLTSFQHK